MQRQLLMTLCAAIVSTSALAQDKFPSKPITMIVPYAAGSSSDVQARMFGEQLAKTLGQGVVVENRPGANAAIGMRALEQAPADGYTIGMAGGSPMVINPLLTKNLGYDPGQFIHVHGVARAPAAFVVSGKSPYKTLPEVVAAAAEQQRPLNIGTYAAIYELAAVALGVEAKQQTQNVPYKGAGAVVTDVIGGHLEMGFIDISNALPLIKEGQLRVLALATPERLPLFSDIPLVSDSYAGFQMTPWTSFVVRKDVPSPVADRLEHAFSEAHDSAVVRDYFQKSGLIPLDQGREKMKQLQAEEEQRFKAVTAAAGIEPK